MKKLVLLTAITPILLAGVSQAGPKQYTDAEALVRAQIALHFDTNRLDDTRVDAYLREYPELLRASTHPGREQRP